MYYLDIMDQTLERHNLPKFTQKIYQNRPISTKEMQSIMNNLTNQKTLGSNGFTGEFY